MNSLAETKRPRLRDQSVSGASASADCHMYMLIMGTEQVQCLDEVPVTLDRIQIADGHDEPVVRFEPQLGTQAGLRRSDGSNAVQNCVDSTSINVQVGADVVGQRM